jgi:hypothetical protein
LCPAGAPDDERRLEQGRVRFIDQAVTEEAKSGMETLLGDD